MVVSLALSDGLSLCVFLSSVVYCCLRLSAVGRDRLWLCVAVCGGRLLFAIVRGCLLLAGVVYGRWLCHWRSLIVFRSVCVCLRLSVVVCGCPLSVVIVFGCAWQGCGGVLLFAIVFGCLLLFGAVQPGDCVTGGL